MSRLVNLDEFVVNEIVRQTSVRSEARSLTVSTVKVGPNRYDTVVFDDSLDKRHAGKRVGGFVIDHSSKRDDTREKAMDTHRAAVLAARDDQIA